MKSGNSNTHSHVLTQISRGTHRTMKGFKPACAETNCLYTPTQSPTLTVRQRGDVLLLDALLFHCHFCLCVMAVTHCSSLVQNHIVTSFFYSQNSGLFCLNFSLVFLFLRSLQILSSFVPVLLYFAHEFALFFSRVFLPCDTYSTILTVNTQVT